MKGFTLIFMRALWNGKWSIYVDGSSEKDYIRSENDFSLAEDIIDRFYAMIDETKLFLCKFS